MIEYHLEIDERYKDVLLELLQAAEEDDLIADYSLRQMTTTNPCAEVEAERQAMKIAQFAKHYGGQMDMAEVEKRMISFLGDKV